MVAPLPVREFASVAEMQAHYAVVRRRMEEGRAAPKIAVPSKVGNDLPRRLTRAWVAPQIFERIEIKTPGQIAGVSLTAGDCLRIAAAASGFAQRDICSDSRKSDLVKARHIAFWLTVKVAKRSLPDVGRRFGGKDHTTVLHGIRRVERIARHLRVSLTGEASEIAATLWAAEWPSEKKLGSAK